MENENNLRHVSISATEGQNIARIFNVNLSPFVFRLPTETLQAIFICQASDYYYGEDHGFSRETPPSWVNVSYVCRHWRTVALSCPILWTFLFSVSTRWMEKLLSRSKQAPLKLHLAEGIILHDETPLVPAMTSLEQVADQAERIQELDLSLDCLPPEQLLSKLFSHALLLRTAKIRVDHGHHEQDWSPSMPFATPTLRTLDVFGYGIPWNSFMLNGVTTLRLYNPRLQQSTEQFLATLNCMRDLRHLYLNSALPGAAEFLSNLAFRNFNKIDLPCLSRLSIAASLSTIIALVSCINIPLQTELRLLCYSEPTIDYTLLSSFFARRFGTTDALSSLTIRSLTINFEDHEPGEAMMSVSFSSHDDHSIRCSMEESWGAGIPLQVVTDRSESMMDNENCIMTILRSVPLMDVHNISILRPPFSSRFWRELLGHFPNLRYLQLLDGRLPDIAPALSFAPSTGDQGECLDRPRNQMLVPRLETLSLFLLSFGEEDSGGNNDTPEPAADVHTLLDALASRTESPGQLTTALCAYRVDGRWGGGRFQSDEE